MLKESSPFLSEVAVATTAPFASVKVNVAPSRTFFGLSLSTFLTWKAAEKICAVTVLDSRFPSWPLALYPNWLWAWTTPERPPLSSLSLVRFCIKSLTSFVNSVGLTTGTPKFASL